MPSRDQRRAEGAYAKIAWVQAHKDSKFQRKYGGICLKMPAMIQHNGLCQAIAFYEAKGADQSQSPDSNSQKLFLRDFARVVMADESVTAERLASAARSTEMTEYQWLTREATQCAVWFKRYAEAVLRVKPGEDGDPE